MVSSLILAGRGSVPVFNLVYTYIGYRYKYTQAGLKRVLQIGWPSLVRAPNTIAITIGSWFGLGV